MPIRTPRGRSAAYRGLWQWPLRSPARLVLTGVVVVAVVVGVTIGLGALQRPSVAAPAPATVPSRSAVGTGEPATVSAPVPYTAATLPPVAELRPTTLPASAAPAAALQVASTWARAWVRPPDGTSQTRWLDGLRSTTTEEYLGVLAGVDPTNIPATKVTGAPRPVTVSPRSLQVQVPTDALTLLLTVVDTGTGWRVAGYDRVAGD